jgi:hypothetical protein
VVAPNADENRDTGFGASNLRFELVDLGDVSEKSGAALQIESEAKGVTEFLRPEDGAWDTTDLSRFYFVTTDRFDQVQAGTGAQVGNSRLWRLDFDSLADPRAGGRIEMLLAGTEGHQMFDNLTVNSRGELLLQEDPGGQDYLARIWHYDPDTDALTALAQHDPARFTPGVPGFLTRDEESSGIVDVSDILGNGARDIYLLDVQAHYALGGELVEGGQLLAMQLDIAGLNGSSASPF